MSKKVLAIYYSQTGQLGEIVDNFTSPLVKQGFTVEKLLIQPKNPYPFPWTGKSFFAQIPDCVLGVPTELGPFSLKESSYDLIVLGYQAWFLSPSIPANSILNHPQMQQVLKGAPVITMTGARNMWISAMERVKGILKIKEARLVGNIALVDRHANFVSFVTILYWMFTGKKDRYLNIFPKPGVADQDITNTKAYGETVLEHLEQNNWDNLQTELVRQKA